MSENVSTDKNRVIAEALETKPKRRSDPAPKMDGSHNLSAGGLHCLDRTPKFGKVWERFVARAFHIDGNAMVALKNGCWKVKVWEVITWHDDDGSWVCQVRHNDSNRLVGESHNSETEMLAVRDAVHEALTNEIVAR